jgi:thioredoxin 1
MSEKLKVTKFYAEWCGPCKVLTPHYKEVQEKFKDSDEVELVEVDVDHDPGEMAAKYGVMGVPALVFTRGEEIVARFPGVRTAEAIEELINTLK